MIATILLVLLFAPGAHAQSHYHDSSLGWSIDLPADWHIASDAQLEAINVAASSMASGTDVAVHYQVAFLGPSTGPLAKCYILVQPLSQIPHGSYDSIEAEITDPETRRKESAIANQLSHNKGLSTAPGTATLDREHNRILRESTVSMPGGPQLSYITAGYLAKEAIVTVLLYAPAVQMDQDRAGLASIMDSFTFDEGVAFVPEQPPMVRLVAMMVGGALLGALAWGIRRMIDSRKKAS